MSQLFTAMRIAYIMYEGELPMQEALLLAPAAIQSVALKKRWVIVAGSSVILGQVAGRLLEFSATVSTGEP
jgi:hypothetical protein